MGLKRMSGFRYKYWNISLLISCLISYKALLPPMIPLSTTNRGVLLL